MNGVSLHVKAGVSFLYGKYLVDENKIIIKLKVK